MLDQDCRHRTSENSENSENSEKTRGSKGEDSNKLYSNYRRGQAVARGRVNRDLQKVLTLSPRSWLTGGLTFTMGFASCRQENSTLGSSYPV